jgi:hypothetical protein
MDPWREIRLLAWAALRNREPFQWGKNDCNQLALKLASMESGRDLLAAVPAYDTPAGAARTAAKISLETLGAGMGGPLATFLQLAGYESRPGALASIGDILVCQFNGEPWERAAVCLGRNALTSTEAAGVIIVHMAEIAGPYAAYRLENRAACPPLGASGGPGDLGPGSRK